MSQLNYVELSRFSIAQRAYRHHDWLVIEEQPDGLQKEYPAETLTECTQIIKDRLDQILTIFDDIGGRRDDTPTISGGRTE